MATTELHAYVKDCFETEERRNGYTNARAVAQNVIRDSKSHLLGYTERQVLRMPTQEFLFEGARETLEELVQSGDEVVIWTQGDPRGQLWKAANTKLGELRRGLLPADRSRFSVFAAMDKITPLPILVKELEEKDVKSIYIVDDKSDNILKVKETLDKAKNNGEINAETKITPVWINQGRTKDVPPPGFTLEEFKKLVITIDDIRDLSGLSTPDQKQGWFIDLDHTLIDTNAAKENLFSSLAKTFEGEHPNPVLSHRLDYRLGLNGNVSNVTELLSGMSDGRVIKVDFSGQSVVIKHNPRFPHKVKREIQGYEKLHDTEIGANMLSPLYTSIEDGLLVIPYYQGEQLREGIRTDRIEAETAKHVLSQLLSGKKSFWKQQEKISPNGDLVSMQRTEWTDTIEKAEETIKHLSATYGIPIDELWNSPIVIKGRKHHSLISIFAQVSEFLGSHPPYAILTHSDASGANILVDPVEKTWKLVDAEWTGYSDPAESFIRMVKYISTTTAKNVERIGAQIRNGELHIDSAVDFPKAAVVLQKHGIGLASIFSHALNDKDFTHRTKLYLAGSYLREFALAIKRGYPELGFFAMAQAAKALEQI